MELQQWLSYWKNIVSPSEGNCYQILQNLGSLLQSESKPKYNPDYEAIINILKDVSNSWCGATHVKCRCKEHLLTLHQIRCREEREKSNKIVRQIYGI